MSDDPIKIFIVDDEQGVCYYMGLALKREGFKIITAMDGPEAVDVYAKERPDLNIIDVDLGWSVIDGVEVLRRIKKINPDAECVMVSRVTDEPYVVQSKEAGARHYILKPFESDAWIKFVHKIAAEVRARRPR